jgi:predicted nucleotidyltransferase component of viral defense system
LDYKKLFHKEEAFQRETFQKRMEEFGFKNMARMELFLWDLELFLHIQKILGDKIILKGGAATQFYLPRDAQRTSVDIDMLFFGTEEEIKETLRKIEEYLGTEDELFYFHKHSPKNPKTNLPLHTYYMKVPSVLSNAERNMDRESIPYQELKIEFILQPEKWEYERRTGENIFAVNSSWNYQILPLNYLFADKLTTLGCNTIGVQNERLDEQVKQFYDIMMLSRNCISEMQCSVVKEKYLKRAEQEWNTRKITLGSTLEGRDYEPKYIVEDVEKQLLRYQQADSGEDAELKKFINDFHSLYLNRKVQYDPKTVACGASLVRLMYELMISGMGWDKVKQALEIEKKLGMEHLSGPEKGQKIRELRNQFIQEFGKDSVIPASTLKGKDLKRVFWAIVNIDNLNKIEGMI